MRRLATVHRERKSPRSAWPITGFPERRNAASHPHFPKRRQALLAVHCRGAGAHGRPLAAICRHRHRTTRCGIWLWCRWRWPGGWRIRPWFGRKARPARARSGSRGPIVGEPAGCQVPASRRVRGVACLLSIASSFTRAASTRCLCSPACSCVNAGWRAFSPCRHGSALTRTTAVSYSRAWRAMPAPEQACSCWLCSRPWARGPSRFGQRAMAASRRRSVARGLAVRAAPDRPCQRTGNPARSGSGGCIPFIRLQSTAQSAPAVPKITVLFDSSREHPYRGGKAGMAYIPIEMTGWPGMWAITSVARNWTKLALLPARREGLAHTRRSG